MKKLLSLIKFFIFNKVNKTNIKKKFFDRINELKKERSDFSFEGEIKEKPQSSSLKQGVDFFKSLKLISINDFYRNVKRISIRSLISKAKLVSVSLDNNLYDCAKLIKEKKTYRIIIEETKKISEVKPESNSRLLQIKIVILLKIIVDLLLMKLCLIFLFKIIMVI